MSFGSGAEAADSVCLLWETTASGRRFEARAVFDEVFEEMRGVLEVVQRDLAEQPAFRSWLLFCRSEVRSIAPAYPEEKDRKSRLRENKM